MSTSTRTSKKRYSPRSHFKLMANKNGTDKKFCKQSFAHVNNYDYCWAFIYKNIHTHAAVNSK